MSEFDKELIGKFKQTFLQKDTGFIHMLPHKQFEVSITMNKKIKFIVLEFKKSICTIWKIKW